MDCNLEPFSVMTIDGLHYIKSVMSDNPYELTLICDNLWEGEVFEVPATIDYKGKEYTVTGIDVGQSTKLENLHELRIPPTVRHIFPEACVGIKSLRKVNIPDYCRVYAGAFARCEDFCAVSDAGGCDYAACPHVYKNPGRTVQKNSALCFAGSIHTFSFCI